MSCAIDTNVLLELVGGDRQSAERAASILEREGSHGGLFVSPPVYAECLAHPGWKAADLNALLRDTGVIVAWDVSERVWVTAGVRFAEYAARRRRAGDGPPRRILSDFVIGAHALEIGGLITYDDFFTSRFPELRIVSK